MTTNHKKILLRILIILAVTGILAFVLTVYFSHKLKKEVEAQFGEVLTYDEIEVDLLGNNMILENAEIALDNAEITAAEIKMNGFGFYEYWKNGKIILDKLFIDQPEISFFQREVDPAETSEKFERDILVKSLQVVQGDLKIVKNDSINKLYYAFSNVEVAGISVNENTVEEKIPFRYESFEIAGDSLFLELDNEHHLTFGNSRLQDQGVSIEELKIIPKYDKVAFQRHISREKDRFDLVIDKVSLDSLSWGYENDSLQLKNPKLTIEGANLEVYRNKLLPDDTTKKTLYSEKIRNSPVKLDFEQVEVKNSRIAYEEKIKEEMEPAVVYFTNVNSSIYGLSNLGLGEADYPGTKIDARANFMGEPLLKVAWEFDAGNVQEEFHISGNFGPLSGEGINSFLKPSLNIEARGGIESLAFNFYGNDDHGRGDMQLKYEDFKIDVLRDEGTRKSGFLSAVANLFIKNDAIDENYDHEGLEVERDKTKSFWNFVWLFIQEGALSSLL